MIEGMTRDDEAEVRAAGVRRVRLVRLADLLQDFTGVEGQHGLDSHVKRLEAARRMLTWFEKQTNPCPTCKGRGEVGGQTMQANDLAMKCSTCNGKGVATAPTPPVPTPFDKTLDGFAVQQLHGHCEFCDNAARAAVNFASVSDFASLSFDLPAEQVGAGHHSVTVTRMTGVLTFELSVSMFLDVDVATGVVSTRVLTPSGAVPIRQLIAPVDHDATDPRVAHAFDLIETNDWERPVLES